MYAPCGRYVVRFTSNAEQQRLRLDVQANALHSSPRERATLSARSTSATAITASSAPGSNTPGIVWGPHHTSAASPAACSPLHLTASLDEADIVTLTASAGVRKNFASFSKMLYDALIGRSACVHFYVETVAEMKERIERDVHQHRGASPSSSPAPSRGFRDRGIGSNCGAGASPAASSTLDHASIGEAAAITHAGSGVGKSEENQRGSAQRAREGPARVCAAVGDTVIELDEDVADEVLEQRFLTLDYDVDFTRAIFPIPLSESTARVESCGDSAATVASVAAATSAAPSSINATTQSDAAARAAQELQKALARVATLEGENAKLQRENAALVMLSKQKMHEMQRLCDDFQQRVRGAAEAEALRAKNAELRVQLQEAIEDTQTALRTLEQERSQRRLLGTPIPVRSGSNSNRVQRPGLASRRSLSGDRGNPYPRSLSHDSHRGGEQGGRTRQQPHSRRGSLGSHDARLDRNGQPLLSPTPTPTSRRRAAHHTAAASQSSSSPHPRRVPTRFDTPPGPSTHNVARSSRRSPGYGSVSNGRLSRASSTHSNTASNSGGGDSPAPRDRTGGRQADVAKPRRSRGSADGPSRSRASSSSTSSVPRRGPSLWADASDHPSPRGSVASSRCSSASHERLYRATTASSRLRQTPKAYSLEELGARRAVFH